MVERGLQRDLDLVKDPHPPVPLYGQVKRVWPFFGKRTQINPKRSVQSLESDWFFLRIKRAITAPIAATMVAPTGTIPSSASPTRHPAHPPARGDTPNPGEPGAALACVSEDAAQLRDASYVTLRPLLPAPMPTCIRG